MKRLGISLLVLASVVPAAATAKRTTIALDGKWQIDDGVNPDQVPAVWTHTAPVPGLANLAQPAFPDVDRFDGKEVLSNRAGFLKILPEDTPLDGPGISHQQRNWFWYKREFRPSARAEIALL